MYKPDALLAHIKYHFVLEIQVQIKTQQHIRSKKKQPFLAAITVKESGIECGAESIARALLRVLREAAGDHRQETRVARLT